MANGQALFDLGWKAMAPSTPHRMVARDGQHEIEIKKSRFITSLFRVTSEEEARARIEATRKTYWDANHN
ncbi:MAG TPA: YigZ family protein, partial [Thermomicrobiales bacterium]|nr:YigZ family protein [Thermomicrobiales bacterium]